MRLPRIPTTIVLLAALALVGLAVLTAATRVTSDSSEVFADASQKMYWAETNAGQIRRANLDGSGVEGVVAAGLLRPRGVALDKSADKLYWTDYGTAKIQRANLDGTGVQDLVTGRVQLGGIALDVTAGKMYWAEAFTDSIRVANLDGSDSRHLIRTSRPPWGIALDLDLGKIYWTQPGAYLDGSIGRANLDGSGIEELLVGSVGFVNDIALDVVAGKMYWTDLNLNNIRRAKLNGSDVEDVVGGLESVTGIALDPIAGKLYWTLSWPDEKLQRANLDGTSVEDLVTGLSDLGGIALDLGQDADGDGVPNALDNCRTVPNQGQSDADSDGAGDACDACPNTDPGVPADSSGCSLAQVDSDGDGVCNLDAPSFGPPPGCVRSAAVGGRLGLLVDAGSWPATAKGSRALGTTMAAGVVLLTAVTTATVGAWFARRHRISR